MKFAIFSDGRPEWWSTLEGARDHATQIFVQNMKYADAIHVYGENDFMHPVLTICRQGYGGPASENRIEILTP